MKKYSALIVIGVIILILGLWIGGTYNTLVTRSESVDSMWSKVDTQLQRRSDLIPNLVSTVQGYASHEEKVFKDIADARAALAGAKTPEKTIEANNQLDGALSRLLVVVENYPDLKANQNFIGLQDELAGTENRIAVARNDYNDEVKGYNTVVQRFPGVIMARMFGFEKKAYFEAKEGTDVAPTVNFPTAKP